MDSAEDDAITVKVRGPRNFEKECFFFLEEILGIIDQVSVFDSVPDAYHFKTIK